jgi:integrase
VCLEKFTNRWIPSWQKSSSVLPFLTRDKAILTLLLRTAQRIGDWNNLAGRHGVLGMALADVDETRKTITVRLKGDRDEHRVPVTDDFWPLFHRYLTEERDTTPATPAAWVGLRRGKGKPLTYSAFESSLRYISRKTGVNVHAHLSVTPSPKRCWKRPAI